jgi:MFS family permease
VARFRTLSRAFEIPGYRWLWAGSLLNWVAAVVATLTYGWLMLQLTNSPFWVGLGLGVRGASQSLFSIPAGAIADRLDRRRILVTTFLLAAAAAAVVALLVLTGRIRPWHLLAFMSFSGLLSALERPSTSGLMYDLVGAERLLNASALRFMGTSLMQILGSLAGGVVLQRFGTGQSFMLAGGAYLGAVASMLILTSVPRPTIALASFAETVVEGCSYALRSRPIRLILILSTIIEGFGFAYGSMMPVMARDVLRVGGLGFGYLAAMSGVGQLIATLLLASRGEIRRTTALLAAAALAFGLLIVVFGLSRWLVLSLPLVVLVHLAGTTYDVSIFTIVSLLASDAMRGRVLGFYSATLGFSQMGGLVIGALATLFGAPGAIVFAGGLSATFALILGPRIRGIRLAPAGSVSEAG